MDPTLLNGAILPPYKNITLLKALTLLSDKLNTINRFSWMVRELQIIVLTCGHLSKVLLPGILITGVVGLFWHSFGHVHISYDMGTR